MGNNNSMPKEPKGLSNFESGKYSAIFPLPKIGGQKSDEKDVNASLEAAVKDHGKRLDTSEKRQDSSEQKAAVTDKRLKAAEEDIASVKLQQAKEAQRTTEIAEVNKLLVDSSTTTAEAAKRLSNLVTGLQADAAIGQKERRDLKHQTQSLRSDQDHTSSVLDTVRAGYEKLSVDVSKLKVGQEKTSADVKKIQDQQVDIRADVSAMQSQHQRETENVNSLIANHAYTEGEINGIKAEQANIRADVSTMQSQHQRTMDNLNAVQSQQDSMAGEITGLKAEQAKTSEGLHEVTVEQKKQAVEIGGMKSRPGRKKKVIRESFEGVATGPSQVRMPPKQQPDSTVNSSQKFASISANWYPHINTFSAHKSTSSHWLLLGSVLIGCSAFLLRWYFDKKDCKSKAEQPINSNSTNENLN